MGADGAVLDPVAGGEYDRRFQEPEGVDSRAYIGWFLLITPERDERALWWDGSCWKTSPNGMKYLGPVQEPIKLVREHERGTEQQQ